jgi:hypothetical protein
MATSDDEVAGELVDRIDGHGQRMMGRIEAIATVASALRNARREMRKAAGDPLICVLRSITERAEQVLGETAKTKFVAAAVLTAYCDRVMALPIDGHAEPTPSPAAGPPAAASDDETTARELAHATLFKTLVCNFGVADQPHFAKCNELAQDILAALRNARREALEEAAKLCDERIPLWDALASVSAFRQEGSWRLEEAQVIRARIRALIPAPAPGEPAVPPASRPDVAPGWEQKVAEEAAAPAPRSAMEVGPCLPIAGGCGNNPCTCGYVQGKKKPSRVCPECKHDHLLGPTGVVVCGGETTGCYCVRG